MVVRRPFLGSGDSSVRGLNRTVIDAGRLSSSCSSDMHIIVAGRFSVDEDRVALNTAPTRGDGVLIL